MTATDTGQVNRSAADIYNDFFVPALFQEWASPVADAASIGPGQRALDVACGTGVLTREVARRFGPDGGAIGLDRNDGMLAVAARSAPAIEWRMGLAEALPFDDDSFDAVVSQFGLMFFEDRHKAIGEIWRVLKPGGHLAVAVWDSLERTPGYAAMTALLQRLFGNDVANALRAPFVLGDPAALVDLFANAGIPDAGITTRTGTARFSSLADWVRIDVKGWTLADLIDDRQFESLQTAAADELAQFVQGDGSVAFASPAHIISARKPV